MARRLKDNRALAKAAGVDVRTVQRWRTEPGFPVDASGRTDLDQLAAWREQSRRKSGPPVRERSPEQQEIDKWAMVRERALAGRQVLALQREKEEVVPRDEVRELFEARVREVKAALLPLPGKLRAVLTEVDGATVQQVLQEEVDYILGAFSRGDPILDGRTRPPRRRRRRRR